MRAFLLLLVCFVSGYFLVYYNSGEALLKRDPAAIKNSFDFSNLRGEQLFSAAKQRLLAGLELARSLPGKPAEARIGLGHFIFTNNKGEKRLACQEFQKVAFSFEAEGVSIAGEKAIMEIEGQCEFSIDMTKINPLALPIARILGETPGDGEFEFNEGSKVTVRFTNLPDQWP
ncbi:MAG: hypothetical protein ACXWRZ_16180, partial [Bdellovibrio sp.]